MERPIDHISGGEGIRETNSRRKFLAENGYILNQEKVMLMLRGISSKPDLIISLDGANDFVITSKLHRTGETYQAGLVEMAVERPFLNAVFAVARKSQFVNALAKFREAGQ